MVEEVIAAATLRPATVLGLGTDLGSLAPSTTADITVLEQESGTYDLHDCCGQVREATELIKPLLSIHGGRVY